jgi:hypothetical protein
LFLLLVLLAGVSPARAQADPVEARAPTVLLAEGGSRWGKFVSSLTTRTRVVQLCVVAMCLALFILMRKFTC